MKQYIPEHRGALVTTAGEKIGEHSGAEFYTIGQRHIDADFTFPKTGGARERKPLYVASKDASNEYGGACGREATIRRLYRGEVELTQMNFISGMAMPATEVRELAVRARVRYRQPLSDAMLSKLEDGNYKLCFARLKSSLPRASRRCFMAQRAKCLVVALSYKIKY